MKPGDIKSDLHRSGQVFNDRAHETEKTGRVDQNLQRSGGDLQVPDGQSQLPEGRSSTTEARQKSQLVKTQAEQKRRTGRRQKLLKVPVVKTLSKQAKLAFKALSDLLSKATELLQRFKRKLMDDDDEEQQRRRQHEEGIPEAEEPKVDPSKVPRPLKPLTT